MNIVCIHQEKKTRAKGNVVLDNGPEWTMVIHQQTNNGGENVAEILVTYLQNTKRKLHRGGNNITTYQTPSLI